MIEKKGFSISKIVIYLVLSLWAVTTVYPFLWVILNSFKDRTQIVANSFVLPLGELFTTKNYSRAFTRFNIWGAYGNSIIISGLVTVFVVIFAGLAAYGLARYHFKGRKALQSLVIASMMFPAFATIIPVFQMENSWGITNTSSVWLSRLSVILPQMAGNLSFAIVVLMGYIRGLPIDLEEAAFIEGCTPVRIFTKVIVPITKPSFVTVAIFSFLWSYNDLFTQMFFLRLEDQWPVTRLLREISSRESTDYGLMAASVTLIVVPIIVIYVVLQKQIIKGLTAGAIKG